MPPSFYYSEYLYVDLLIEKFQFLNSVVVLYTDLKLSMPKFWLDFLQLDTYETESFITNFKTGLNSCVKE